jgi:hypothetical protein
MPILIALQKQHDDLQFALANNIAGWERFMASSWSFYIFDKMAEIL